MNVGREPLIDGPYPNLRVLNQDQQLELFNVQLEDAGTYSCKATNPAGRDRQEFYLRVYCKYSILILGSFFQLYVRFLLWNLTQST